MPVIRNKKLLVHRRGSRIVGCMSWATPYIVFLDRSGKRYYWTSDHIERWTHGSWDKWDKRRGKPVDLREGQAVIVSAFVRPDGETLYRVSLQNK